MRVTVVLVTYNSASLLGDAIDALPAALAGLDHELVVADNASTDATIGVLGRLRPDARVVQVGHNLGYAAGINAAIGAASPSDAVLILNPDVRLAPGSVATMASALAHREFGIVAPKVVGSDGALDLTLRRAPTVLRAFGEAVLGGRLAGRWPALGEVERRAGAYTHPTSADWAVGACLLVSRACLADVGPWDESFFLYSEETDFALRAAERGYQLRFVPDATAVHLRGEAPTNPRLWSILQYNRFALHRKRHGLVAGLAFRLALIVNAALRAPRAATYRAALAALVVPGRGRRLIEPHTGATGATPAYVCFAGLDWWYHSPAHSDFQLMRRIAETRPVLLVNSIGMRVPLPGRTAMPWRRVLRKARSVAKLLRRPIPELPRFHVMTPLSIPVPGWPRAQALNAALVRAQVRLAMRVLGIRRAVCVVTLPTAWDVVRPLRWEKIVYNRSDKQSAYPEANAVAIQALEHALLAVSDHVLYASRMLMAEEAHLSSDRAVFFDHGVDVDHFRPSANGLPADLAVVPRPRIGYFGAIRDYSTDLELLARVAREVPEASLVLVGDAQCSLRSLEQLPNVFWLGPKPYDEVPTYGSGFDVALLPLLANDFTRYQNPIKLKEYLALDLRVVTTDLPEVQPYDGLVRVGRDSDDFVAQVRHTLAADRSSEAGLRRAAVAGATWDQRARDLICLVEGRTLRARA